jgi:hypothetical protein
VAIIIIIWGWYDRPNCGHHHHHLGLVQQAKLWPSSSSSGAGTIGQTVAIIIIVWGWYNRPNCGHHHHRLGLVR